jgi:hypothetical protein
MSDDRYEGIEFSAVNRDAPGYQKMVERLAVEGDPTLEDPAPPQGEFSIGGELWPGLSKLLEECGEVGQVAGKIIGAEGRHDHWDGSHLPSRLADELADLEAAILFVKQHNALPDRAARVGEKLVLFNKWHRERLAARDAA